MTVHKTLCIFSGPLSNLYKIKRIQSIQHRNIGTLQWAGPSSVCRFALVLCILSQVRSYCWAHWRNVIQIIGVSRGTCKGSRCTLASMLRYQANVPILRLQFLLLHALAHWRHSGERGRGGLPWVTPSPSRGWHPNEKNCGWIYKEHWTKRCRKMGDETRRQRWLKRSPLFFMEK